MKNIPATLFTSNFFLKNRIFDMDDEVSNRDDCLYGMYLMKKTFSEHGINISTQDINPPQKSRFTLFIEAPIKAPDLRNNNYVILFEPAVRRPFNWKLSHRKNYKKIFTWNDDVIDYARMRDKNDDNKYIKINFPNRIPKKIVFPPMRKKLLTMIVGNKASPHPHQLYSERLKMINWFEKNHPDVFDFYGINWNEYKFHGKFAHLNRFKFLTNILTSISPPRHSSYKGKINKKKDTLMKYNYAICFENSKNTNGYITEKIFDCFFSGCIPIYWGAPNINDYVPDKTYINMNDFQDYQTLFNYLINISESEYDSYIKEIKKYLKSDKIKQFSDVSFSDIITNTIISDLNL